MNNRLWAETQSESSKNAWRVSILAMIGIIVLFAIAQSSSRTGSAPAHIGGEVVSAALAFLSGIALLSRYSVRNEPKFLLLGAGFMGAAALDLLHAVLISPTVAEPIGDIESLVTLTWLSGRIFLSVFAVIAALSVVRPSVASAATPMKVAIASIVAIAALTAGATLIQAPSQLTSTFIFTRPADMLIGLIFLAAFIGFARHGIGGMGSITAWVTISLLVNAMAQLMFMSLSEASLDAHYSSTHMLKLIAYSLVSIGVSVDAHWSYQREKSVSDELGRVNEFLNQRNMDLTTARNDLTSLTRLAAIASSSVAVADHFDEFAIELRKRVPADRIVIATSNEDLDVCRIEAAWGTSISNRSMGDQLPVKGRLMGEILHSAETIVLNEATILEALRKDPRLQADIDSGFKSWANAPVIAKGKVIGALLVRSKQADAYLEREINFLEQVAAQIAGPLSVSRQLEKFVDVDSFETAA